MNALSHAVIQLPTFYLACHRVEFLTHIKGTFSTLHTVLNIFQSSEFRMGCQDYTVVAAYFVIN